MGNKTSCVSAPIDDGEYIPSRSKSSKSSKSSSTTNTESLSISSSSITPPAPSPSDDESICSSTEYPYYPIPVKLLFLDVDGVLNNPQTSWDEYVNGIDELLLKYLKLIILKTGCKIVLSTTWRLNENAKRILLHSLKTRADLNTDDIVIGQTKSLKNIGKHRTNEIYHYLKRNQYRFNIITWCALDDLPLNSFDKQSAIIMNGHFVKTNPKIGISPENALKCIDILNANDYYTNTYHYTHYTSSNTSFYT